MSPHLTDRDLLQGLDDELSESRKVAVEWHVRECETCRRRQAAIQQASVAASSAYRALTGADQGIDASRERLKDRLSQAARESAARQCYDGMTGHETVFRRALAWSGATAVAAMVAWLTISIALGGLHIFPAGGPGAPLPLASITPGATWDVSGGRSVCGHEAHANDHRGDARAGSQRLQHGTRPHRSV